MHVGGGADRSTSRADPPQGADGDHRAGEGDPRPACGTLRSQSAACPHLRTARRGQNGGGAADSGGGEGAGGIPLSAEGKICGN